MAKVRSKIHRIQCSVCRDIVRTPPTNKLWADIARYFNRTHNFSAGMQLANRKSKP